MAGIRGCSCRHSSLLTGRLAMRAASITALRGACDEVVLATLIANRAGPGVRVQDHPVVLRILHFILSLCGE